MSNVKKIFSEVERVIAQFDGLFQLREAMKGLVNVEAVAEQAEERRGNAERDCTILEDKLQSMAQTAKDGLAKAQADHRAALESMDAEYDRAEASRRADHEATMKERTGQLNEIQRSIETEQARLAEIVSDRQLAQNELAELTTKLNSLKQSVAGIPG